ncbi:MAG: ankyrin repeat domain-containing protein [Myxococcales bacterium]
MIRLVVALALLSAAPADPAPDAAALRAAASEGRVDSLRSLLDGGASVDAKGPQDWTALHAAVIAGQAEAAALLLERGADPNARGRYDLTPLHWAAMKGRADLAKLLIKRGAKPDARDLWSRTALHVAAQEKVVRALVELGADVNAQDAKGITPLHVARNEDVANVLLEAQGGLAAASLRGADGAGARRSQGRRSTMACTCSPGARRCACGKTAPTSSSRCATSPTSRSTASPSPSRSSACQARLPVTGFSLQPGELAIPSVAMVRTPDTKEGPYPLMGTMKLGGAEIAKLELTVDTTRGVTPEDQGMIHLGSGSLRRAPEAWANVAFVLGPIVLLGLWFGVRAWKKRSGATK